MTVDGTYKIIKVEKVPNEGYRFIDEERGHVLSSSLDNPRCEALSKMCPFYVDYVVDYSIPNEEMRILGFRF